MKQFGIAALVIVSFAAAFAARGQGASGAASLPVPEAPRASPIPALVRAVEEALPAVVPVAGMSAELRLGELFSGDDAPLLVFFESDSGERASEVDQDARIMSRVLSNALAREFPDGFARPGLFGLSGKPFEGNGVRAMYVQNVGPFFMLNVRFPLVPPPDEPPSGNAVASQRDALWEQAKQEIADPGARNVFRVFRDESESTIAFDGRTIERFIETLIESLKQAANMRLGDNESVAIVVRGPRGGAVVRTDSVVMERHQNSAIEYAPAVTEVRAVERTTLVIRARALDTKRFASGELSRDAFRDAIRVNAY